MDYACVFSLERVKPTPNGGFQTLTFPVATKHVDRAEEQR